MFINFHRIMAFMKEMFTFSCYNHLNSLIMMNAFRNWYEKRQIRLKHFVVNLLVKIV